MKRLAEEIRNLSPAYFALVMATGIVGIASHQVGFRALSVAFLGPNVPQYVVLWILTVWRAWRYPDAFGSDLIGHQSGPGFFTAVAGTWWIPMLVILAVWRHVYKRFRLAYDPLYWGAVFPLGMYTASTLEMARAMHLEFLDALPRIFIFVALAAWLLIFWGLLRTLIRFFHKELPGGSSKDRPVSSARD
jgi:tellurite resistance protein TehA-like permease